MVARRKLLAERKIGGSKEKIGGLSRRARVKTKKKNWVKPKNVNITMWVRQDNPPHKENCHG